jgi:hypothetical protein
MFSTLGPRVQTGGLYPVILALCSLRAFGSG